MKFNRFFQLGLCAAALTVSCVAEQTEAPQLYDGETLVAGIETSGTRASVNEELQVLWDAGDAISVFRQTTQNKEYQLQGEGGVTKGTFSKVSGTGYGDAVSHIYAVYPYSEETRLSRSEVLSLTLPSEQAYAKNSFGPGANTMVAVSDTTTLQFKNLCGYVGIQLCGDAAVKSITFYGNAGEVLSGPAEVTAAQDADPKIQFTGEEVAGGITLTCEQPVQLSMDDTTLFWIVVPPTEFVEGISVLVAYEGAEGEDTMEQVSEKVLKIERNELIKMAPLCIKTQKELTIQRVWGKYPMGPGSPWTDMFTQAGSFVKGNDRAVAADEEYVYVASANAKTFGVAAISIADPTQVKEVNMTGVEGGYFPTACVRTIKNPATGKYILLVGSMAMDNDDMFNVYAYEKGPDAAPTKLLSWKTNGRRFGDMFSVAGDWANGELWLRINGEASTTIFWKITDGKISSGAIGGGVGYGASYGMGAVYKYSVEASQFLLETPNVGLCYDYKASTWIESSAGVVWDKKDQSVMCRKFGVTPFTFNGVKYIAYTQMGKYTDPKNAARARVKIIADQGSAETFRASIEADDVVYECPIQNGNDKAATAAEFDEVLYLDNPSFAGQVLGSCSVVEMEEAVYIVSHLYNVGVSVFKMSME